MSLTKLFCNIDDFCKEFTPKLTPHEKSRDCQENLSLSEVLREARVL